MPSGRQRSHVLCPRQRVGHIQRHHVSPARQFFGQRPALDFHRGRQQLSPARRQHRHGQAALDTGQDRRQHSLQAAGDHQQAAALGRQTEAPPHRPQHIQPVVRRQARVWVRRGDVKTGPLVRSRQRENGHAQAGLPRPVAERQAGLPRRRPGLRPGTRHPHRPAHARYFRDPQLELSHAGILT